MRAFSEHGVIMVASVLKSDIAAQISVRRALDTLKEKNYISWISGGKGKRNESNSNKYTLYLSAIPSHSDTPTVSERAGEGPTVIPSQSHSETQKRIEKESNKKLTNELAELVGESFEEAAKPRAQEVPTANCESVNPPAEKRNARLESIMKDPAAWALCEERCANLKDGKCAEGQTIPPDKRDWPIPPEQCSHFVSSGE